ncbi:tripartite tricarboxylate transporter substrate binding protein [Hydrogenophaga sp.]|uniref:Bug family tripartite tricarboxylate transporter substrate binding protein n=1 Tax=Hydrogenophaga sp. TaxID=1904254 RepID=UPI002726CE91|nr:tripartite tricarboxylate transporter substrate binding protein [Hydrogenophaga sp.]MDO9435836.1 tripartite tricarboxylate transporter substrate binding protein [Hydrogenophaga sp.]
MISKRMLLAGLLAATVACFANAQPAYPNKPIQVILPLAAGSSGDALLRVVLQQMSEGMGQSFAIDNQPGASGLIGADKVKRAAPDGYTLGGFSDSVLNYAPNLLPSAGFDPVKDFEPITLVSDISWVLVVHPSMPARTVNELVALAKSAPGKLDYGSAGNGSPHHIVMELFKSATRTAITHIPYKGATPATTDVVAGQISLMFSGTSVALPFIKEGKLRALAVMSPQRSTLLPDVPTMQEAGLKDFTFSTWLGLYAPKGTPRPVIDKINTELAKAIKVPRIHERLVSMGFDPGSSTPEEQATRTRAGFEKIRKVIQDAKIKAD